jgi:crotonobetainyl-CoA:carnitine CoA-transferase CaiB-like acyl-CoA transferase
VVDAAISESMFNMLEGCVPELAAHGATRPPSGSTLTGVVPSGTWRAADGVYVIIGGNGNSGGLGVGWVLVGGGRSL